jgi:TolB-like protein
VPDIFLSYNREDQARAKLFAEAFKAHGLDVWWDTALTPGEAYDQVTEKALKEARAVVVLWSKKSVDSRWVRAEATLADRNKTLVPVMIEPCERPIMFELTQTAELSHWKGDADDKAWQIFLAGLKRFVATRLQLPAPTKVMPTLAQIVTEPEKPPETMLAVLPFDNLSSDAEMQFFSDGVSEDILGLIQRGSKLKVISRTSSFQFRGLDKPKAATALKATHIVDGSIRRAGGKVRIAAQLTEAATQHTLWSDKYDRSLDDIFTVQDEISEAVAQALNAVFTTQKTAAIDPVAYDLYLRARDQAPDPEIAIRNVATLETVTRLAPDFADAWAALAFQRLMPIGQLPYAERAPMQAKMYADLTRCLALDPDNVLAARSEFLACDPFGAYLAHNKIMRRIREIGANSASALSALAWHLESVGRNREAVSFARRARDLDPKDSFVRALYSQGLWRAGRFAEGRSALEADLALWPDHHFSAWTLILACAHQHDWAAVDERLDPQRLERYPLREHSHVIGLVALLRSPVRESRRLVLHVMRERVEKTGHLDPAAVIWPAIAGFADEAFDILDGAKFGPSGGLGDSMGFTAYRTHMIFSAAFTELRANPRFVKMCARLGLVEYWLGTGTWPDCADEVAYDFRAECAQHRDYPKDMFFG